VKSCSSSSPFLRLALSLEQELSVKLAAYVTEERVGIPIVVAVADVQEAESTNFKLKPFAAQQISPF